jgi:hypothetical protein
MITMTQAAAQGSMIGTSVLYAGLVACALGLALAVRVHPTLGRRGALALLGGGLLLAVLGALLPVGESRSAGADDIDRFLPRWHFNEVHETTVHAPASRVMQAVHSVTPREIRFLRGLMAIRSLGFFHRDPDEEGRPMLEVARRGGFLVLEEDGERELVLGVAGRFWRLTGTRVRLAGPAEFLAFDRAGCARAAVNFRLVDDGPGRTRVITETRILAVDDEARRKFGAYWRLIYPGSALIRRSWLAAIKARAESPGEGERR